MLAEAKALGEVRVALSRGDAELGGLEAGLCKLFGLSEAIVAPFSSGSQIRPRRSQRRSGTTFRRCCTTT